MENLTDMLSLARAIRNVTGCTDATEIRNAVDEWGGYPDDVTLTIDGEEWRFIESDKIDEIMQDELESEPYILGCFNASFLASILDTSSSAIEAIQKAGDSALSGLGEMILSGGHLKDLQEAYAQADGYGHHFSSYDGNEETFDLGDVCNLMYHAFRVG